MSGASANVQTCALTHYGVMDGWPQQAATPANADWCGLAHACAHMHVHTGFDTFVLAAGWARACVQTEETWKQQHRVGCNAQQFNLVPMLMCSTPLDMRWPTIGQPTT